MTGCRVDAFVTDLPSPYLISTYILILFNLLFHFPLGKCFHFLFLFPPFIPFSTSLDTRYFVPYLDSSFFPLLYDLFQFPPMPGVLQHHDPSLSQKLLILPPLYPSKTHTWLSILTVTPLLRLYHLSVLSFELLLESSSFCFLPL